MLNAKGGGVQSHIAAHETRELDVSDLLVAGVLPVNPVLLYCRDLEVELSSYSGDCAGVVGLDTSNGDESIGALRDGFGGKVSISIVNDPKLISPQRLGVGG